jgi:1,4-alpha-glucan branching enzyme
MTQLSKKSTQKNEENNQESVRLKPDKKKYEEENFIDTSKAVWNYSMLTDEDVKNYQQGTNYSLYEKFGSHSGRSKRYMGHLFLCMGAKWKLRFCCWQF